MPDPWNHWFHCTANTYGTWLPGDPRGFRTRHHREHVVGDYKSPPIEGRYDERLRHARRLMNRPPVHIPTHLRATILAYLIQGLHEHGLLVIVASLDDHHLHVLARFPHHNPKVRLGIAKQSASAQFKRHHSAECERLNIPLDGDEGIWAKGSKAIPIRGRSHQLNVARYIRRHRRQGAVLWLLSLAPRRSTSTPRPPR